ncbi:MAG: hypothetical protein ACFFDI_02785 [Promethearchaeota archaeon]
MKTKLSEPFEALKKLITERIHDHEPVRGRELKKFDVPVPFGKILWIG